jgi:hypothetical protein
MIAPAGRDVKTAKGRVRENFRKFYTAGQDGQPSSFMVQFGVETGKELAYGRTEKG